ncbi:18091_t:CDS:2 [Funneliformis geosporum]|uniref:18091_t:CDS:1 n=1 Tax=Funneliformis geosporum TaxID=1117311 RepID=A0A9W4X0X6_9GLOM|nr:18091_t:CDS:2 [Funneliformis geosporum]
MPRLHYFKNNALWDLESFLNWKSCDSETAQELAEEALKEFKNISEFILVKKSQLNNEKRKYPQDKGSGDMLPDGTKIEKATLLDLVQSDDDTHLSQEDNDKDEGIPNLKDTVINNSKKWNLPSGLYVVKFSIKKYGALNIIDLSVMSEWFSTKDIKFMAKNYADLLKVSQLLAEENSFILKMVLKGDVNGAYKLCIENHINSEENGYIHKISKIYAELSKNKVDILDYTGDIHTELDVVMKAYGYIIKGLNPGFEIHQKWDESFSLLSKSNDYNKSQKCDLRFLSISGVNIGEWKFASKVIPHKAVSDHCRSARVNQSILNGLLNLNLTDE